MRLDAYPYDVSPDGRRFVVNTLMDDDDVDHHHRGAQLDCRLDEAIGHACEVTHIYEDRGLMAEKPAVPCCTSEMSASLVAMPMRHAELPSGIALEVELDHDRRLVTDDPSVVSGLNCDHFGRRESRDASIGVLDVNTAARQESYMRVHAEIGAHDWPHVDGPPNPGG